MARIAIGDIQGCAEELRALLERVRFSPDRDELWFVGDLVNRGPRSLEALRSVRSLDANAIVVLGNHDLHLLALAFGAVREPRPGDTLDQVLAAPDRDALIAWLIERPLAYFDAAHGDLLVHAGIIPQWSIAQTLELAAATSSALRRDPERFLGEMYGDRPDVWSEALAGTERLRFAVNVLTRMRVCTADGRIDLKMKGPPGGARRAFRPWFEHARRASGAARIVFGHWSALGYVRAHGVIGLDTGCVWGGALTAVDLDRDSAPVSVPCGGYRSVERS
ncbi:MAG TPA: symmetrical bis(5'-nucleosyl)-tetraphosphatase [Steroidobacteraceae bacterium]|nr:symmetrical bis(5'-nucleosyl)-tetraphosphatase [Steroidobacteraceae bacterium]